MTDEKIQEMAIQAMAWARGSWGQGTYDAPRFEKQTMVKLYQAIAEIANKQAELHANSDSVK
jgi:hypothetical protein